MKSSVASVEQMELYTDTENCEAVISPLSPFFCSFLFADEFAEEFANKFASEFVNKFFPNSYL